MTVSLYDMLAKRHPPPGWILMYEVGNGTGYNVSRHADAVAFSIWPSRGHAIHGFEFKASRSDVQKELADLEKADAVGKYCDYWWLVVEDLKIIDGLVIPETWGILAPKNNVLREHRKAPKREPKETGRPFAAAMIRRVVDNWVPKHEHDALKKNAREEARKEIESERKYKQVDAERELAAFRNMVANFEERSGVKLTEEHGYDPGVAHPRADWHLKEIAEAVKVVVEARERAGRRFAGDDPVGLVRMELDRIERSIENAERIAGNRRAAADQVRSLLAELESQEAKVAG